MNLNYAHILLNIPINPTTTATQPYLALHQCPALTLTPPTTTPPPLTTNSLPPLRLPPPLPYSPYLQPLLRLPPLHLQAPTTPTAYPLRLPPPPHSAYHHSPCHYSTYPYSAYNRPPTTTPATNTTTPLRLPPLPLPPLHLPTLRIQPTSYPHSAYHHSACQHHHPTPPTPTPPATTLPTTTAPTPGITALPVKTCAHVVGAHASVNSDLCSRRVGVVCNVFCDSGYRPVVAASATTSAASTSPVIDLTKVTCQASLEWTTSSICG